MAKQLVSYLTPTSLYGVKVGVLETAHSIFRHWRIQVRSDDLFTEINYVFSIFMKPFLQLFEETAKLLFSPTSSPDIALVTEAQILLADIFYDFTCQDLPPDIEDSHGKFFDEEGLFHRFLLWDCPQLRGDVCISLPTRSVAQKLCLA